MKLYRAVVTNLCDDEDYLESTIVLDYKEFDVIKETLHYYVINFNSKEKRIGINSKSKFANITKEKALIDAAHRNRRYRAILNAKILYAKKVLNFINDKLDKKE
jgi:hypothetical protein